MGRIVICEGLSLIVCATIVEGCRVLLVKHADLKKPDCGDWLLPAGSVESGESLEEALKREIGEELNLRIKVIRKLVEHIDPYTKDRLVNFLCSPLTSRIETSSELSETGWFDEKEIQALENIHAGLKRFLIEGFKDEAFEE
jgi:8-oxo-dGTP pyrophosphatase MutT (NUDIX family)